MRFFADRERSEAPRAVAADVEKAPERAARAPGGPIRHAVLAAVLVRAGELAQGLGDAAARGSCGSGLLPFYRACCLALELAR